MEWIKVKQKPMIFKAMQIDVQAIKRQVNKHFKLHFKHSIRCKDSIRADIKVDEFTYTITVDGGSITRIAICISDYFQSLADKDWIVQDSDGRFAVYDDTAFKLKFEIIDSDTK